MKENASALRKVMSMHARRMGPAGCVVALSTRTVSFLASSSNAWRNTTSSQRSKCELSKYTVPKNSPLASSQYSIVVVVKVEVRVVVTDEVGVVLVTVVVKVEDTVLVEMDEAVDVPVEVEVVVEVLVELVVREDVRVDVPVVVSVLVAVEEAVVVLVDVSVVETVEVDVLVDVLVSEVELVVVSVLDCVVVSVDVAVVVDVEVSVLVPVDDAVVVDMDESVLVTVDVDVLVSVEELVVVSVLVEKLVSVEVSVVDPVVVPVLVIVDVMVVKSYIKSRAYGLTPANVIKKPGSLSTDERIKWRYAIMSANTSGTPPVVLYLKNRRTWNVLVCVEISAQVRLISFPYTRMRSRAAAKTFSFKSARVDTRLYERIRPSYRKVPKLYPSAGAMHFGTFDVVWVVVSELVTVDVRVDVDVEVSVLVLVEVSVLVLVEVSVLVLVLEAVVVTVVVMVEVGDEKPISNRVATYVTGGTRIRNFDCETFSFKCFAAPMKLEYEGAVRFLYRTPSCASDPSQYCTHNFTRIVVAVKPISEHVTMTLPP